MQDLRLHGADLGVQGLGFRHMAIFSQFMVLLLTKNLNPKP